MQSPLVSLIKVRANLLKNGTDIIISAVSHRLSKKFVLKYYKPAAKPRLTSALKKKKLSFANKYLHWTVEKWETVLFSDESTVEQFAVWKKHAQRPKCQRFNAKYTIGTVKYLQSLMVWGTMSKHGTAGLYFFAPGTTINGMKYVQMLQEKRNIYMVIHNTSICMHEAPCHRSKVVSKHLRKSKVKDLLPGRSPDLNPIENLWSYIKNKVAEKQPSTGKKLVTAIKEVWVKEISTEYCASLIKVCLAVLLQ